MSQENKGLKGRQKREGRDSRKKGERDTQEESGQSVGGNKNPRTH